VFKVKKFCCNSNLISDNNCWQDVNYTRDLTLETCVDYRKMSSVYVKQHHFENTFYFVPDIIADNECKRNQLGRDNFLCSSQVDMSKETVRYYMN